MRIWYLFAWILVEKALCHMLCYCTITARQGRIQGGGDWGNRPLKTCESNFIHHDFVQLGKQHSRYKAILPSIV